MHSKSDNIEIVINDKADEVIEELFGSLVKNCQIGFVKPMKGSDFVLNCTHLLHYKCHKINLNCGGSNVGSPNWIKSKKVTIYHINKKR